MAPGPTRRLGGQNRGTDSNSGKAMRQKTSHSQPSSAPTFLFDQEGSEPVSQGDATRPLTPLDLSLAPFRFEEDDEDNAIYDAEAVNELGPAACQIIDEDELDDVEGMPTRAQWKTIVQAYLDGLHPTKRHKSLISQEFYKMIFRTLRAPDATRLGTPQFRFWARKMFQLVEAPNHILVVTNGGRPVAIKEHIYDILCMCHSECGHGGRDKTCKVLREYYTWVPKELIAKFVKACPTCAPSKVAHSKIKYPKAEASPPTPQESPPASRFSVQRLSDFGQLPTPSSDESHQLKLPPLDNDSASVSVFQYERSNRSFTRAGSALVGSHQHTSLPSPWTGNLHGYTLPPLNTGSEIDDVKGDSDVSEGSKQLSLPPLMQYLSRSYGGGRTNLPAGDGHAALSRMSSVPIDPTLLHAPSRSSDSPCACNNQECSGCQVAVDEQHGNALHLQLHPVPTLDSSHHIAHHLTVDTSMGQATNTMRGAQEAAYQWEFPSVASVYSGAGDNSALLSASTASIGLPTPSGSGQISPEESGHAHAFLYYSPEADSRPGFVGIPHDGRLAIHASEDGALETKTKPRMPRSCTPPLLYPRPVKLENTAAVLELTAAASMDEAHD